MSVVEEQYAFQKSAQIIKVIISLLNFHKLGKDYNQCQD
jgi:hypothetical protein